MESQERRKWETLTDDQRNMLLAIVETLMGSYLTYDHFAETMSRLLEDVPGLEILSESKRASLSRTLEGIRMAKKEAKPKKPSAKPMKGDVKKDKVEQRPQSRLQSPLNLLLHQEDRPGGTCRQKGDRGGTGRHQGWKIEGRCRLGDLWSLEGPGKGADRRRVHQGCDAYRERRADVLVQLSQAGCKEAKPTA